MSLTQRILVVGEDEISCALGERLVETALPKWTLTGPTINTHGVTKLQASLPRYLNLAINVQPVLCVADSDGQCAIEWLEKWRPKPLHSNLLIRLAVPESESWVLADRYGLARALHIPVSKLPNHPDKENDPKRLILGLASRSKKRQIRDEMVSERDVSKQGSGYNFHLCEFVRTGWNIEQAAQASPSLRRALNHLSKIS